MKRILALALSVVLLLTSCSGSSSSQGKTPPDASGTETEYKDTLVIGIEADPILDPWVMVFPYYDLIVARQVYDPLFRIDEKGELVPCLVEKYEWVDDTHIKLNLRRGIKFHDGSDFTSKDVMHFMELIPANERAASRFPCFDENKHEIVDDHTIIIALKYAFVEAPFLMSRFYIPSKTSYESMGTANFNLSPVGTGPYKMVNWTTGSEIVTERFDDYWGGPYKQGVGATKKIISRIIPDASSRVIELESGGIDIAMNAGTANFKRIEETEGIKLLTGPSYSFVSLIFSMKEPLLEKKEVRSALIESLDIQALIDACYNSYYLKMNTPYPSLFFGAKEMPEIKYNLEHAKQLMKEAGCEEGFTIRLLCQDDAEKSIAEAIQGMWSKINVNAEVLQMPTATYVAQGHTYQTSLSLGVSPVLSSAIQRFQYNAGVQLQPPGEGRMGELVLLANGERDDSKRLAYLEELQDIVYEDRHVINIAQCITAFGLSDKVEDFAFEAYGAPYLMSAKVKK